MVVVEMAISCIGWLVVQRTSAMSSSERAQLMALRMIMVWDGSAVPRDKKSSVLSGGLSPVGEGVWFGERLVGLFRGDGSPWFLGHCRWWKVTTKTTKPVFGINSTTTTCITSIF